jgi:hypothetical protein
METETAVRHRRRPSPYTPAELAHFGTLLAHQSHGILESCEGLSPSTSEYLERAHEELRNISGALERIEKRHYGRCVGCGEAIPAERLRAVPSTPTCGPCSWESAALAP